MKIQISTDLLLNLIKEDIKINYLYLSFEKLGFECSVSFPNLSSLVFQYCGVSIDVENDESEEYYKFLNSFQDLSYSELTEKLENFDFEDVSQWLKIRT